MDNKKKTLTMDDFVTERKVGRRSMLGMVGGGVLAGAAATVMGASANQASAQESMELVTDSDTGRFADPGNRPSTGHTDRDSRGGPNGSGDPGGYGICPRRGHSDQDPDDPAGGGRGPCR